MMMLLPWSLILLVVVFQVVVSRWSLERESKRRWQHALTGHTLVQISYILPFLWCVVSLTLASFGIIYLCFYQQDIYTKLFGSLLRPEESGGRSLPGAFYFLVGTCITLLLVPLPIARYAVACLSWADPMAAWVGRTIQTPMWTASASVAGSVACFGTAWTMGYTYLTLLDDENSTPISFWTISVGAFICTIAEANGVWLFNDNLSIPIATALAVHTHQKIVSQG